MPSFRKLQVHSFSSDFRGATQIVEEPELPTPRAGHVVVQNHYVGINATDVNVTNGGYGNTTLPFGCGLEAVGVVALVAEDVTDVSVGDAVAYRSLGAFAEYTEVEATKLIKTPGVSPVYVPLTVCGVSAITALEKVGQLGTNETVLVTAAAGGTGQFVVQLAKLAGNHVIGTCSSDDKVEYLKSLGVDRVINYTKEDIGTVLKTEYPNGVNLVFESVGGDGYKTILDNIAVHGRILIFGSVASYKGAKLENPLLFHEVGRYIQRRSVSIRGFFMPNFAEFGPEYITKLVKLIDEGKIKAGIDPTEFKGLEGIADAIDRLYAKQNIGKMIVKLV
uniref:Enoyl reductase (ER) domain-containing protein n=1 Tax=Globisporangium ultimum (strain ATCC 200006 / CBS 805.95 / DAOM BR144) TaxID=431595 RepID=K3WRT0_GLOUD